MLLQLIVSCVGSIAGKNQAQMSPLYACQSVLHVELTCDCQHLQHGAGHVAKAVFQSLLELYRQPVLLRELPANANIYCQSMVHSQ